MPVMITRMKPQSTAEAIAATGLFFKPNAETAPPMADDRKNTASPMGRVSDAGSGERRQRAAETRDSNIDAQIAAVAPISAFFETVKKSGVDWVLLFFFFWLFMVVGEGIR